MVGDDIREKMTLVTTFLKNMDNEDFQRKIENKEDLIGQYKGLLAFLPAEYAEVIGSLTPEMVKELLKREIPEKYEIVEKLDRWDYLEGQFDELKKVIGK
jgi:hypothetical protein